MVRIAVVVITALFCCARVCAADATGDAARKSINLEALSRLKGLDLEANPSLKSVVLKLLEQVGGTPQFVEIVRDFNLKGQEAELLEIAAKDSSGPAGVEAMRLVLKGDQTTLKSFVETTNAPGLIKAMGNTGDKEIVPLLQPLLADTSRSLALRQQAVRAMAKVQEGAAALIDLARKQKLPEDLRGTAGVELKSIRWNQLKSEAAQWLPSPGSEGGHVLPPVSELVKMKGDPEKGASVFKRETVGCSKCHQVNGQGTDFGPNLSEIGTKLAKSAIYESILDPSAGISFGYEAWELSLSNGEDAFGLIVSETSEEVMLKAVGGIVNHYKKTDLVKRVRQKLSIMPAGLEQTMSTDDLVDLVEFLSGLKKAE